jgi:hypothetical protein
MGNMLFEIPRFLHSAGTPGAQKAAALPIQIHRIRWGLSPLRPR